MNDPKQSDAVVDYYRHVVELVANVSSFRKFMDVFRLVPAKYVYDSNAGIYWRIHGNHFPWFRTKFVEYPLVAPPETPTALSVHSFSRSENQMTANAEAVLV